MVLLSWSTGLVGYQALNKYYYYLLLNKNFLIKTIYNYILICHEVKL